MDLKKIALSFVVAFGLCTLSAQAQCAVKCDNTSSQQQVDKQAKKCPNSGKNCDRQQAKACDKQSSKACKKQSAKACSQRKKNCQPVCKKEGAKKVQKCCKK